ncbi:hypothetical protein DPMN_022908 [Dreissena polymorpha]|uniref:Endonuclease/exonuclease/phosphatase domain-containing protein n=1 Tax=Dreissena polymorpha TaxID=45954 RepID=A0A9D4LL95_DREPO|nr:hypothetical protein DPMN_022908 [Dreissena polymorpha]
MGDFNARFPRSDVTTHLRSRGMYVTELAKSLHLYVATDTVSCTGPPFTFYPYNDVNPSRIDHVLLDERLSHTVNSCGVIPDAPLNVSRHLPVFISLSIDIRQDECSSQALPRVTYRWSNSYEINEYKNAVSEHLCATQLDNTDVNETYSHIVRCISSAAEKCVSKQTYKRFLKSFWFAELKNKNHQLRLARPAWIWSGRFTRICALQSNEENLSTKPSHGQSPLR